MSRVVTEGDGVNIVEEEWYVKKVGGRFKLCMACLFRVNEYYVYDEEEECFEREMRFGHMVVVDSAGRVVEERILWNDRDGWGEEEIKAVVRSNSLKVAVEQEYETVLLKNDEVVAVKRAWLFDISSEGYAHWSYEEEEEIEYY